MKNKPVNRLLVICGHNAGRSQLTEGLFNHIVLQYPALAGRWEAISAGTRPGEKINPLVEQVMSEIGIDMDPAKHFPKGLQSDFIRQKGPSIRRVVIACDDDCVFPPGIPSDIPKESWKLPDPHQQPIEVVRTVRDLARDRVEQLLEELATSD